MPWVQDVSLSMTLVTRCAVLIRPLADRLEYVDEEDEEEANDDEWDD